MLEEAERFCHEVRFETGRCVKMRCDRGSAPDPLGSSPDSLAGYVVGGRGMGIERAMD